MALPRLVFPEIMDQLPATDAGAMAIRNDLSSINRLIPNARIVAKTLSERFATPPRVLMEIGCGNGTWMLGVARRLAPRWRGVTVVLLDQQDLVTQETRDAFAELGWTAEPVAADVFDGLKNAGARKPAAREPDAIVSNLFLHHFQNEQLESLLEHIAQAAPMLIACEPRRSKLSLRIGQMGWVIGFGDLTCHDVAASVWAGFKGRELTALWPKDAHWTTHEYQSWPFTHCFTARRNSTAAATPTA